MKLYDLEFKRIFSTSNRRKYRIPAGGMSFLNEIIGDKRSDLYPVLNSEGEINESVSGGVYTASSDVGGSVARLIGSFFPYYTYSISIESINEAKVGIRIDHPIHRLTASFSESSASVEFMGRTILSKECDVRAGDTVSVTLRAGGVSLYRLRDGKEMLIDDFCDNANDSAIKDLSENGLYALLSEKIYKEAHAALEVDLSANSELKLSDVSVYLSGGIGQADIRPMKYENGEVITEGGRVFLTASERLETGAYQSILSWLPTTSDIRMEGALFFDLGDGVASNDVATTAIFDREAKEWYIWFCAFSHGHALARAKTRADIRRGISIIDATPLPKLPEDDKINLGAVFGDEDPDLIKVGNEWHLAVCRCESDGYHYYRFTSSDPLDNFTLADRTPGKEKTGGSFVSFEGEIYFVCGSDFKRRAVYEVYELNDFSSPHPLKHDFDDGGFRGWGSVFGLDIGTRRRYFHLTFDRFLTSKKWNWSYGNIYAFEADKYFKI